MSLKEKMWWLFDEDNDEEVGAFREEDVREAVLLWKAHMKKHFGIITYDRELKAFQDIFGVWKE